MTEPTAARSSVAPPDPHQILRSRGYVGLLIMGALVGVPVAFVAYWFLVFVSKSQTWVFVSLPQDLGFDTAPVWWPVLPLMLSGLLVALSITYLPGSSGHRPAEGLKATGATAPRDLAGVFVASLATLCLGAVLGPEAPLIAIGSGLGALAVHLLKKDAPEQATLVIGAAGSFAAIATLLGSPLTGAFLLMEAVGLGGPVMGVILVPGLLAAGVGSLIFVGLDSWTGYGTFALEISNIPAFGTPTLGEFGWALVIGLVSAVAGLFIKRGALALQDIVDRQRILLTPLVGLAIALLAITFQATTDKSSQIVLFSGQDALPTLIDNAATWSVWALVMLMVCKGLAYTLSLSSFRGGPIFPAMFIGAAFGIALSSLPGLPMIAGVAMGIGAMCVAMLGLPLVSVLLPSLLLAGDAVSLMPLVIVAVVVSYVASARLEPRFGTSRVQTA